MTADTARTDQRQQAAFRLREQRADLRQFVAAADEARFRFGRQRRHVGQCRQPGHEGTGFGCWLQPQLVHQPLRECAVGPLGFVDSTELAQRPEPRAQRIFVEGILLEQPLRKRKHVFGGARFDKLGQSPAEPLGQTPAF